MTLEEGVEFPVSCCWNGLGESVEPRPPNTNEEDDWAALLVVGVDGGLKLKPLLLLLGNAPLDAEACEAPNTNGCGSGVSVVVAVVVVAFPKVKGDAGVAGWVFNDPEVVVEGNAPNTLLLTLVELLVVLLVVVLADVDPNMNGALLLLLVSLLLADAEPKPTLKNEPLVASFVPLFPLAVLLPKPLALANNEGVGAVASFAIWSDDFEKPNWNKLGVLPTWLVK